MLKLAKTNRFESIPVFLSTKQVLEKLMICRGTLWKLEKQKLIEPYYIGKKKMYPESEILRFLNSVN